MSWTESNQQFVWKFVETDWPISESGQGRPLISFLIKFEQKVINGLPEITWQLAN